MCVVGRGVLVPLSWCGGGPGGGGGLRGGGCGVVMVWSFLLWQRWHACRGGAVVDGALLGGALYSNCGCGVACAGRGGGGNGGALVGGAA